jgi:hypothetical protein
MALLVRFVPEARIDLSQGDLFAAAATLRNRWVEALAAAPIDSDQ